MSGRKIIPALERFHEKVVHDGVSTCWHWSGSANPKYGSFAVDATKASPKRVQSHRFAYEAYVGPIPAGLELDHLCRNTFCVNPAHLEPVTRRENMARVSLSNRKSPERYRRKPKLICKRGHELSVTGIVVTETGGRECGACRPLKYRNYRARRGIGERRLVTDSEKAEIRALVASGAKYPALSEKFGLSKATICRVIRGRR